MPHPRKRIRTCSGRLFPIISQISIFRVWLREIWTKFKLWMKKGSFPPKFSRFRRLIEFKNENHFVDISFIGNKFTWRKKKEINNIYERLNRALIHLQIFNWFPNICMRNHVLSLSDHCPITVELNDDINSKRNLSILKTHGRWRRISKLLLSKPGDTNPMVRTCSSLWKNYNY